MANKKGVFVAACYEFLMYPAQLDTIGVRLETEVVDQVSEFLVAK